MSMDIEQRAMCRDGHVVEVEGCSLARQAEGKEGEGEGREEAERDDRDDREVDSKGRLVKIKKSAAGAPAPRFSAPEPGPRDRSRAGPRRAFAALMNTAFIACSLAHAPHAIVVALVNPSGATRMSVLATL